MNESTQSTRRSRENLLWREFDSAFQAISGHANFYLQYTEHTYIRVYGSKEQYFLLHRYASDRLVLMEFVRHLLFLKERVWRKKDATINLQIAISSYVWQTWVEAKSMRKEL